MCKLEAFLITRSISERKGKTKQEHTQMFKLKVSTFIVSSTFQQVPKKIYKPVLQYPCKLNPAEAAIISIINQKYSLVKKGPSNN